MKRTILLAPILVLGAACTNSDFPTEAADNCAPIFAQDDMPQYHVTISQTDWSEMHDEFVNVVARTAAGLDPTPYHPIGLTIEHAGQSEDVQNAEIRLKGASSWLLAIENDPDPKMQFVISFDQLDKAGRFEGLRKVDLDMPRNDRTFLQQRVAMWWLRQDGLVAPCANNGQIWINGTLYGLYTNLEAQDKSFLTRNFPGEDGGDLWKSGHVAQTNKSSPDWTKLNEFWHPSDFAQMTSLIDLDGSMKEWVGEAMIGDADGYNLGRPNFYLYDQPNGKGYLWLANDLDTAIDWDYWSPSASPVFSPAPPYEPRWEPDWLHYMTIMVKPDEVAKYVAAMRDARAHYDEDALEQRITAWNDQIADAVAEDPHRPFTVPDHELAISRMAAYIPAHQAYIDQWLACWNGGGADADGDGVDMCHDCNDADASVHPGAPEVCNMVDDDCNGAVDNVDGVSVCH
jgi:hypothetical protein